MFFFFVIYLFRKKYPVLYLCVAKVCESLGLAVHLKVKRVHLFRGVLVSAMTITYQYVTCFIQRPVIYRSLIMFVEVNHVTNKGDYWGPRKKSWCCSSGQNILQNLRLRVWTLLIHSQTDCVQMEEIHDHCYLPEKWSTNKDHSKAGRVIVCEVAKCPRVTSMQLKAFLTLTNVNVHEPSIRTLSNHGVHGRYARRKPLFSKKKIAC